MSPPPRAAFPHPKRGQYPPSTTRRDRRKFVIQKRRFVAGTTTAMTAMIAPTRWKRSRQDPRKLLRPTRYRHGRGTESTFPDAFSFSVSAGRTPLPRVVSPKNQVRPPLRVSPFELLEKRRIIGLGIPRGAKNQKMFPHFLKIVLFRFLQ